ncbi:MAG TPA: hypothetical protein VMF13_14480 [Luteitalea sp.]|nr:hypothetical protein [Luteitalea sp.]
MTQCMAVRVSTALAVVVSMTTMAHAQGRVTVGAAAVRVVGPGIGASGTEKRPFNMGPGTTVTLVVKVPKGAGIVEIEDDDSVLDVATDDKGTDLREETDFGSFPDIVADGSAGLIDVEVGKRPAKGAAAITLEGHLSVTTAAGSKPVKSAAVALAPAKTVKLGTFAVTVKEVTVADDGVDLTLTLPGAAFRSLQGLRFQDAKGVAIESDRRGSSSSPDEAEVYYKLKSPAKTVTMVADVWQGLKTEAVPFKVVVGLGID